MPSQTARATAPDSAPLPGPGARSWALFLDVDGVLLDIAPRPELVTVPPGLVRLLHALHGLTGGALALVSGRPLSQLDALFGWDHCDAAGCHGAEIRVQGRTRSHAGDRTPLAAILPELSAATARVPGARLEVKGCAAAFHYRVAALGEDEARALVAAAAAPALHGLRMLCGKCVIELMPPGVDKGAAISRLMDLPPYRGRIHVFAGDDITGEGGFAAVNRAGGFSVAVGLRPSAAAAFTLTGAAAVRDWLRAVAHALTLTGAV